MRRADLVYVVQIISETGITATGISSEKEVAVKHAVNRAERKRADLGLPKSQRTMNISYWIHSNQYNTRDVLKEETMIVRIRS